MRFCDGLDELHEAQLAFRSWVRGHARTGGGEYTARRHTPWISSFDLQRIAARVLTHAVMHLTTADHTEQLNETTGPATRQNISFFCKATTRDIIYQLLRQFDLALELAAKTL